MDIGMINATIELDMSIAVGVHSIQYLISEFEFRSKDILNDREENLLYKRVHRNLVEFKNRWLVYQSDLYETPLLQVKDLIDKWEIVIDDCILKGFSRYTGCLREYKIIVYLESLFKNAKSTFAELVDGHKFELEILDEHFDATGKY